MIKKQGTVLVTDQIWGVLDFKDDSDKTLKKSSSVKIQDKRIFITKGTAVTILLLWRILMPRLQSMYILGLSKNFAHFGQDPCLETNPEVVRTVVDLRQIGLLAKQVSCPECLIKGTMRLQQDQRKGLVVSHFSVMNVTNWSQSQFFPLQQNLMHRVPTNPLSSTRQQHLPLFSKRLGTVLRNLVTDCSKRGITLVGREQGWLTANTIRKLCIYFDRAIRGNNSAAGMRQAVLASLYHGYSTDEHPQHQYCPPGVGIASDDMGIHPSNFCYSCLDMNRHIKRHSYAGTIQYARQLAQNSAHLWVPYDRNIRAEDCPVCDSVRVTKQHH
ncbi:hypothetical protein PoB_000385800 [Plakobranchus ocellatus]|uniref:Uncharacterized protein n=1 Tax=Plakobranchus ocellatus TaxID=259542 RepID=A0AAV3Y4N8_9GAST|nr:hypothetical protein PoB_000385800 [Plakobranchus ocellatus]